MKRFFCIPPLFFLLIPDLLFTGENSVYRYEFSEGSQTFIFGDNARARKEPVIKNNNVMGSLVAETQVTIINRSGNYMIVD